MRKIASDPVFFVFFIIAPNCSFDIFSPSLVRMYSLVPDVLSQLICLGHGGAV